MKSTARRSFVDRALSLVGLQRATGGARASVYGAARPGRTTGDWFTQILSADQEIKADFRRLRGAGRALVRDNSFGTRYVGLLQENVVGPNGITMQARAMNSRKTLNTALNKQIENAWTDWGTPANASSDGKLSWTDIQHLVIASLAQDGEVLIRIIKGADNPFNFALQILDPDQLDDTYNVLPSGPTDNEIRMGVEVNQFGKPIQYWLWRTHPNDPRAGQKRFAVPADEIIHLFMVRRPGQTRGVTWFAPVMFDQQMLQGYQEAEITAARIGSSNMAAVTYDPEKAGGGSFDDEDDPSSVEDIPMEVDPGRFMRLRPGENLIATDFKHPSTAFGPFVKSILRSIATGLNVAYCSLTGDLEAVNFSSIKAGLLGERDFYMKLQEWITIHLHARVYREWAPFAALGGYFSATEARGTERIVWQARRWKSIDPMGDIQAGVLARRAGLTTLTALCAEQGSDFEENLEQIAEEDKLAKQYGVTLNLDTTATNKTPDEAEPAGTPSSDPADESDSPDDAESPAKAPAKAPAIPIRRRQAALAGVP